MFAAQSIILETEKQMGSTCSKDMAVCLVIFNPAKSKKIIQNYYEMVEALGDVPVYTLELVFNDEIPQILNAIHHKSSSYMFHKEKLYRVLEKHIPQKYTKLAFIDSDILFDFDWYQKTSRLLNSYDVVQMFSEAHWMDARGNTILSRDTVLKMKLSEWDTSFHPGFAWGMRRDWYNKVGFFDWAVSGSGDTLSAMAWLSKRPKQDFQSLPKPIAKKYFDFTLLPKPRISFVQGTVHHLFHGSRENRQYASRHRMIDVDEEIDDMLVDNTIFEWKDPKWNAIFLEYFISRKDDEVLTSRQDTQEACNSPEATQACESNHEIHTESDPPFQSS